MVKVVEMTQEEKLKMYMETDKEKLALMLINCNDIIDVLLKEKSGNLPEANRNAMLADGLPDHYAGDLNKQRIKQYKMLANRYGVKDDIAMHIFCAGADWYKQQVKGNVT